MIKGFVLFFKLLPVKLAPGGGVSRPLRRSGIGVTIVGGRLRLCATPWLFRPDVAT